jgi:dihydrolipoamide dehydrogenase
VKLLTGGVSGLLKRRKVDQLQGTARLSGPKQVTVEHADGSTTDVQGDAVILATGSRPIELPDLAFDGEHVLNSDQLLKRTDLPARFAVIGGGVVGCEFASLYRMLGAEVAVIEMREVLLPGADEAVSKELARAFKRRGIRLFLDDKVEKIDRDPSGVSLKLRSGEPYEADVVLVSVGRRPNTEGLGLEDLGVELTPHGYVAIDDFARATHPWLYAIGDVNGLFQLAHVATHQGLVAVEHALGHSVARTIEREIIPSAVYCDPEIGSVGLTEAQAKEKVGAIRKASIPIRMLGRAHAGGEIEGVYKVIADEATGQLLGVHIVSHDASELLHAATIALSHEATLESVARTIHGHPTYGEAFMEACELALGRPIHG